MDDFTFQRLAKLVGNGIALPDNDAAAFAHERCQRIKRFRSFDFGELDKYANLGNSEGAALKERNAKWASNWASKTPEIKPFSFYQDTTPLYSGPFWFDPDGCGHERDMQLHWREIVKMRAGVYAA